jgi:alkanesulfonate monooxygenase SsuD/methylene tetrahydromethanopterin reductase-like flavin-dependent oxidoreductase (luciferase family)
MWAYVTDDAATAERRLESLARLLNRDPVALAGQVLIGPPDECAAKLRAYAAIGVHSVFIWPLAEPVAQLRTFARDVAPLV